MVKELFRIIIVLAAAPWHPKKSGTNLSASLDTIRVFDGTSPNQNADEAAKNNLAPELGRQV